LSIVEGYLSAFNQQPPVEGQRVRVNFDITTLDIGDENTGGAPDRTFSVNTTDSPNDPDLSVANCNFAIALRSSFEAAADALVSGVLPPLTEPVGVDVDDEGSPAPAWTPAARFAAFSASLFCFDDEGGMRSLSVADRWRTVSTKKSDRKRTSNESVQTNRHAILS
jgi:hypothetical protein